MGGMGGRASSSRSTMEDREMEEPTSKWGRRGFI
jgi:hypothetical protein